VSGVVMMMMIIIIMTMTMTMMMVIDELHVLVRTRVCIDQTQDGLSQLIKDCQGA